MVAHPALVVKEVVRFPGSVASHRSLRIPDGASRRPVRVQVAVRTAAAVCGSRVFLFLGLGQNERDLHPIHRYRWWRELLKGGVVPTSPTRELYVQGSQEHQLPGSNPRTGRLKTYALTIGPCESLTHYGGSAGYEANPMCAGRVLQACQTVGGWDQWVQAVVRRSIHSTFSRRCVVVC